jgi:ubiquinone biosynthesis protein COQ4
MVAQQGCEPSLERGAGRSIRRQAGPLAQLRAEYCVAEGGGGDEIDDRLGVLLVDVDAEGRTRHPHLVHGPNDLQRHPVVLLVKSVGAGDSEPSQALRQTAAESIEHFAEDALGMYVGRMQRQYQLVLEFDHGAIRQRPNQPFPAAEMMEDDRMRDSEIGRHILQPDPRGPSLGESRLGGVQNLPTGILGRPADPLRPGSRGGLLHTHAHFPIDNFVNRPYLERTEPDNGSCSMSILAQESTRIRPLVALRALRALFREGGDTKQVFIIGDALRGRSGERAFERFRRSGVGRAVLAEKRSLLAVLSDRARMAALPVGSLGRTYHDFMAVEDLSADGLVEAAKAAGVTAPSDEQRIFRERNRDQHDLHHVTTGYGRDPLGEICLLTFGYAQTRNRGMGIIALAGAFKGARAFPKQPIWAAVRQAYRHGRAAATLVEQDWEALLPQSLETVRRRLAIQEPTLYQRISAALRSGEAVLPLAQAPALAAE